MTSEPLPPVPAEPERGADQNADTTKPRLRRWIIVGALVVAVAVLVVVVVNLTARNPFESAIEDCNLENSADVRLGDGGDTLIVDGKGEDSSGAAIDTIACVATSLDVPDSVVAQMDGTRALDGAQTAEFEGITVRWSYHPDNGLDLIFSR